MSTQKYVQQLEITIKDGYVEFRFGKSIFKLHLDKRGNPLFPDSVKNELPAYIPRMLEEIVGRMRHDPSYHLGLDPEHCDWCAEVTGTGECDCFPNFRDNNPREYIQTLTCDVCDVSTTGRLEQCSSLKEWSYWWIWKGERMVRGYWTFDDEPKRLICEDCLRKDIAREKDKTQAIDVTDE